MTHRETLSQRAARLHLGPDSMIGEATLVALGWPDIRGMMREADDVAALGLFLRLLEQALGLFWTSRDDVYVCPHRSNGRTYAVSTSTTRTTRQEPET